MNSTFAQLVNNPYMSLLCGLVLLGSAGYEVVMGIGDLVVGAHHGVALLGLLQILKALPEVRHGAEELDDSEDERVLRNNSAPRADSSLADMEL